MCESDKDGLVTRRFASWMSLPKPDVTPAVSQAIQRLMHDNLRLRAGIKKWLIDPAHPIEMRVSDQHSDYFAQDKMAILAECRVLLTDQQDLEHRIEEQVVRVLNLSMELENGPAPQWITNSDPDSGRHETMEEARTRVEVQLAVETERHEALVAELREKFGDSDELVPLRLVPIEIFGEDDCCEHDIEPCKSDGYGLCDAVSSWSDCNRADGKFYRVDDIDPECRKPGETVEILVKRSDLPFFERRWGYRYRNGVSE